MDFHAIEAPHDCLEPPNQALLRLGFKPPFKSWMHVGEWEHVIDPSTKLKVPVPIYKYATDESIKIISEELLKD